MDYKRYEKYKDSGIEWIGDIPEQWKVVSIGKIANIKSSRRVYEEDYLESGIPFYRSKEIVELTKGKETTSDIYISKELFNKLKQIGAVSKKDDMLITSIGTIGRTWIVDDREFAYKDGNITQIDSNKNINTRYIQYCFSSNMLKEQYNIFSAGSTLMALTIEKIKQLIVTFPSLEEQIQIANFLDKKTTEIDNLIKDKENLIELLKEQRQSIITEAVIKGLDKNVSMKYSGVEWSETIPANWNVSRLKHIADIEISNVDKKTVDGEKSVTLCNYTDVYYNNVINSKIDFMKATAKDEQITKFTLKYQDVMITKDSESPLDIGVPAWVEEDLDGVLCGYHMAHIRCRNNALGKYIYYSMLANGIRDQYYSTANGVTRFGLGKDSIRNSIFFIPDMNEQEEIVNYLDKKTIEIDSLISDVKVGINNLKEYKQSLISEVVTGKINILGE